MSPYPVGVGCTDHSFPATGEHAADSYGVESLGANHTHTWFLEDSERHFTSDG
jgi:hypothetical protein